MTVGTRHRTRESPDFNLVIDNNKIKQVHNQILLDINIDENLLYTEHRDYLCTTISSKITLTEVTVMLYSNINSKTIYLKLHSHTH